MPITSLSDDQSTAGAEKSAVPGRTIVLLVAAVAAAWIAAGSTGLLGHSLRHALTWLALGVAVVAGWPQRDRSLWQWLALAGGVLLGLVMTASTLPAVNVLAVTLVTAALVRSPTNLRGRVILITVLATAVLAVFRLACTSIPTVWLLVDAVGGALGRLAGGITGEPLWIGATFGGVDFLVLMAALYGGWLICTSPPRLPRAIYAAAAILTGHLLYLIVFSYCRVVLDGLPEVVRPETYDVSNNRLGVWTWGNAARSLLPWNLSVLAGVIHATIAVVMFRWATWLPVVEPDSDDPPQKLKEQKPYARLIDPMFYGPVLLAAFIPVLTVLGLSRSDLTGKTIVVYEQGYLNWTKPEYPDQKEDDKQPERTKPNAGNYGMLEPFVESLGGTFFRSAALSEEDLAEPESKVLLLLHPDRPWTEEQLDRIEQFVRGGGSLLVAAEPRIDERGSKSSFNEVLGPTAMRVRYDTAISETDNWEHSLETLAHPVTAGIGDRRNRFGLWMGSSIDVRWPARPLLAGRFAFSDPGSDAANTFAYQYDSGEKLGDLVLAAEQRIGRGRIVVLGDAASLDNDAITNSYMFVGRLLGYLAGDARSPQNGWRQLLGLLAMAVLVGLLAWRADALRTAAVAMALGLSLTCCVVGSYQAGRVLPDGRHGQAPNTLAYIDASHLEAYSSKTYSGNSWEDFGIGGLARTLMRSGYLPLLLPELTRERLEGAGLLISIAPARRFSRGERETVSKFVESGGTLICMVGAEEVTASQDLLADFDFHVRPSPVPPWSRAREPVPLGAGFFQTLYINYEDQKAEMVCYASWEVECGAENLWKMVQWSDGVTDRPFIVSRGVGRGTVAVIGDTYLAANKNLESAAGTFPENVVFWRWFLTHITDHPDWTPPKGKDAANREEAP